MTEVDAHEQMYRAARNKEHRTLILQGVKESKSSHSEQVSRYLETEML